MAIENFAVFILSHGRPNRVLTYGLLKRRNYTGPVYIIIDNEDDQADEYRKRYGDQVIVFDKAAEAARTDQGDNFPKRNTVLFARNACFQIARNLGVEYFLELDDDYTEFSYKFTPSLSYKEQGVHNLDGLFAAILEYYQSIPALTIAMAQKGEILGGAASSSVEKIWLKRKAMNSFFCSVNRPFQFIGRMNDDVNTYVVLGNRGGLFLTFFNITLNQTTTQDASGGLTEMYLDYGTYVKSFYTVMYAPSCTKVGETGLTHRRIHHQIDWNTAVPKIMSEQYRKASAHDGRQRA